MKKLTWKFVLYAVLAVSAAMFLLPLVWMLSTALKPVEQTMSMPPRWLPYRSYVKHDGKDVEVAVGRQFTTPSLLVEEGDGKEHVVPSNELRDGQVTVTSDSGDARRAKVKVVREIPATAKAPWVEIRPADNPDARPQFVLESTLKEKVSPRWGNFSKAVKAMKHFPLYLKNTLILCVLTVIGTVSSSALAAYGFSRIDWRGRDKIFLLALATMMIPFPVVMVPLYSLFRALGWVGTLKPLWVGSFCAGAFNVFLLRQFFMSIPRELSEAARIDGCSEFRIFWQITLPLAKPALMVVGLFQFMATWNDFLGPLIYLTDQEDFTLALGLQFFQSQHGGTEWHYLMAASALIVLPVIVLFFFTQKSFVEGISLTGVKG